MIGLAVGIPIEGEIGDEVRLVDGTGGAEVEVVAGRLDGGGGVIGE